MFFSSSLFRQKFYVKNQITDNFRNIYQGQFLISGGYTFYLSNSFYLTTWLGIAILSQEDQSTLDDVDIKSNSVTPVGAIHFGYKF